MARFLLLQYGFEKPTPEIMAAWQKWFSSVENATKDKGGVRTGSKITKKARKSLHFGPKALTGFLIIEAENFQQAEEIAAQSPFIHSAEIYEIAEG